MSWEIGLSIAVLVVQAGLVLVWFFSKGYIKKKAENLATLEDIGKITKKVEAIKSDLNRSSALKVKKYSDQYETLKNIWEKLAEANLLALCVITSINVDPELIPHQYKKGFLNDFSKAYLALVRCIGEARPFLPFDICNALDEFRDSAGSQFLDISSPGKILDNLPEKELEKYQENAEELMGLYNDCHIKIQNWLSQEDYYLNQEAEEK